MPNSSRLLLPGLIMGLGAGLLSSCMTFEIGSNASMTEKSENAYETVHGSMYGFSWSEHHIQKCDKSALAQTEYHFNGLQLLASAVTLGLYVPQTVEWWCDDPTMVDDAAEPGLDPSEEFPGSPGSRSEGPQP